MGVLIQAMVWMGLPQPPVWQLVLYMLCIGMFGVGVGMLYTPILVDRMQLTFPVGPRGRQHPARADRPGAAAALGGASSAAAWRSASPAASRRRRSRCSARSSCPTSTFGAGMIVGARIGIPAIVGGAARLALMPYFVSIGWLQRGRAVPQDHLPDRARHDHGRGDRRHVADPLPRLAALARRRGARAPASRAGRTGSASNTRRLVAWVVVLGRRRRRRRPRRCWTSRSATCVIAVALVFVFAMVNGISLGITDSNPISSAFVVTRDPDGGASA